MRAGIFKVVTDHTCATSLDNLNTVEKSHGHPKKGSNKGSKKGSRLKSLGERKEDSKGDWEGDPEGDPKGDSKKGSKRGSKSWFLYDEVDTRRPYFFEKHICSVIKKSQV